MEKEDNIIIEKILNNLENNRVGLFGFDLKNNLENYKLYENYKKVIKKIEE
jgi:hypothetical protein